MADNSEVHGYDFGNARNVMFGLLIGGLAGAATMLLLAPQSGKQTRDQIRMKSIELRGQASDMMKNTIAQVRSDTLAVSDGVREKAGQFKHLGQDQLVKQLDRASAAVKAA